jgi:conjugal transfer/entry exclusion protein
MKTTLATLIFIFASMTAAHAGGGGGGGSIVYDPTNHAENMVTAARSVYAETQRATQIYNQLNQYRHMLAQSQGIDQTVLYGLLNQNGEDLRMMQTYIGSMSTLIGDSSKLKEMALNRAVDWGNSGLSFEEYAKRESDRIAGGDRRRAQLQVAELSALQSVNRDVEYVQQVQRQIPGATANQSAEIMNSQLNRLVAQNATVIQLHAADRASQRADAISKDAQTQDQERLMREAAAKRNQTIQTEIERLNQPPQAKGGER